MKVDGEAQILELWGMWSTPLLSGPLRNSVLVTVKVPFKGQIKLLNLLLGIIINIK